MQDFKPRPLGIKGENISFLLSISPAVKSFTPLTGVYIAQLLINRKLYRWGKHPLSIVWLELKVYA